MKKLGLARVFLVILTMVAFSGTMVCAEIHHVADCTVCHYGLGGSSEASACGDSENLKMVREEIVTPNSGTKPVVFTGAYVRGTVPYDGVCEVCHTETAYHRNDSSGDHTHYAGENCVSCHLHHLTVNPTASLKRLILDPVAVSGDSTNAWSVSLGDKVDAVTSIDEYIYPSFNDERQYFTFEDPPVEASGDILSVRLWVRAKSYNGIKVRRDLKIDYYDGYAESSYKQKIKVSDSYEYYYAEWDVNPQDGSAWEWDDIDSWEGGVASGSPNAGVGGVKTGAEVGRIWLEVVYLSLIHI